MEQILQKAVDLSNSIKEMMGDEYGFYISNLTHYLVCKHGIVKLNLNAGDPINSSSVTSKCLKANCRTIAKVGPEVYGMAYTGVVNPLYENGKLVGTLALIFPSRVEIIKESSEAIEVRALDINSATQELSANTEEFAATIQNLNEQVIHIRESVQATDQIIELIQDVSRNTHLLGLNARIEAARAGETGNGFAVVAEEIQKMAENVKNAVRDVTQKLHSMQTAVKTMSTVIEEISASAENQAQATAGIANSVEQLHKLTSDIMYEANQLAQ